MSLDTAVQHLVAAKRISGSSQSYAKDNPVEWQKVKTYLSGGARPTGVTTQMGLGLIEIEDARRASGPAGTVASSIANGATLSGSVTWTATVVGATASKVEFLIDDTVRWTEATAPYQYNGDPAGQLDTTPLANGAHTLKARATVPGGTIEVSASVTVSNVSHTSSAVSAPTSAVTQ